MSSIAGVYLLDGSPVDPDRLKRMNDRLSHRGPDGSGLWCEGSVGLGHQMLWTTPESLHEKLPLEADGLVITADARIDNREELLPELGLREDVSDSEVILETYRKWGRNCVDRLLGDFAFVVWDKAKGELFCARDHMGVKPFYYYHEPGKIFAFATEIKALFAWGVPREINEVMIGDYLAINAEDKEMTFFQGILRLPPANSMNISPVNLSRVEYWALDPTRKIRLESDNEYAQAFLDIFKEAVRCRLRSAFPVGSFLSGGLDSSSIVCVAAKLLSEDLRLKTFSAVFDIKKECDERVYINSVLDKYNLESHFIHGDEIGPLYDLDEVLWHNDQPFFGPNLFLHWAIYKEAHNQNVRVMLDGIDGDNVVSHGGAYLTELTRNIKLISLYKELNGLSRTRNASIRKLILKYSVNPFVPAPLRQMMRRLRNQKKNQLAHDCLINSIFAENIRLADRVRALKESKSLPKTAREQQWQKLTFGIQQYILELVNAASAAFLIESRNPFFDKRLMEFCLALPGDQKIRCGWTRWIMRNALSAFLPEKISKRGGKSDLSSNFLHGLFEYQHDTLYDLLFNSNPAMWSYVNRSELDRRYNRYSTHLGPQSAGKKAQSIFMVAILALWLRSMSE